MPLQNLPGGAGSEPLRQEAQGAPAAPEYSIRALVRADAKQEIWTHMPQRGSEIRVMRPSAKSDVYWCSEGYIWKASSLDILPADGGGAAPEPSLGEGSMIELDSLLADYGLAFQQAGWDWRVKLDAAKAKIIEWVSRTRAPAPTVPKGG